MKEYKNIKVNKFNAMLFSCIKWYCNLINITVLFMEKKDTFSTSETLFINTNGNIGI